MASSDPSDSRNRELRELIDRVERAPSREGRTIKLLAVERGAD